MGYSNRLTVYERPADPGARETPDVPPVIGPAGRPGPGDASDFCAAIIARLLPDLSMPERERLGLRLAEQAAARLDRHWHASIADRPVLHDPALPAPDFKLAVPEVLLSITWPGALMLLADDPVDPTMVALASPVAAVRESALVAMESDAPLRRLSQACEAICHAHLARTLERMPPADREQPGAASDREGNKAVPRMEPVSAPTHQTATEPALLAALRSGDNQRAIALLAAAALVPAESIETAISLRSRRGLVSLAWKAGFSMRAAVLLQTELGGFPTCAVLTATADGSCPLSRSEMVWQIGFLARKLI